MKASSPAIDKYYRDVQRIKDWGGSHKETAIRQAFITLLNRSALEWVLDQYKEKKPKDPTIAEKFNTYRFADHRKKVIQPVVPDRFTAHPQPFAYGSKITIFNPCTPTISFTNSNTTHRSTRPCSVA